MTLKIRVAMDYLGLPKGASYYLFPSGAEGRRARLLLYVEGAAGWYTKIFQIQRMDFEEGLHKAIFVLERNDHGLPPYLADVDTSPLYVQLADGESSTSRVCNERLQEIGPLVERWEAISGADNPDREIAKYARERGKETNKKINPTRLRLWLYSYMLHGMNPIVLAPQHFNSGTWSREDRDEVLQKPGPKPKHQIGTQYGRVNRGTKDAIVRGFERFSSREGTFEGTYISTLIHEIGCVTEIDPVAEFHPTCTSSCIRLDH